MVRQSSPFLSLNEITAFSILLVSVITSYNTLTLKLTKGHFIQSSQLHFLYYFQYLNFCFKKPTKNQNQTRNLYW